MTLGAGTRLGPYEIVALIGAGGMGEVYRAHDTKLNRDVAIKILPDQLAADPDRLTRFRREAQVLASLNHPNIAHIHGFEESAITRSGQASGVHALVMELVEGPTLADRIATGPIPLSEALPIARQIADALEHAHEQGIVHRDLKPANIKVRDDGTVKVLDFGLAKALAPDAGSGTSNASNSPTLTARATTLGMILGTAAYMAPEQARGRSVDRRADIWAFGVVLYEMLTGRRAFDGDDISITLASVLKEDVKWSALPPYLPASIHRVLRRCLEKDPRRRLSAIGDARLELDAADDPPEGPPVPVARPPAHRSTISMIATMLVVAAVGATAAWWFKPAPAVTDAVARFRYPLPEGQAFTRTGRHSLAISPDGTKVAYVANKQLYLRHLNQLDAQPIRGTNDDPVDPLFSPDSQWVAYFAPVAGDTTPGTSDWSIRKVAVAGGAPITLCSFGEAEWGGSWRGSAIVFALRSGVYRVADGGGTPEQLAKAEIKKETLAHPRLLDDEHVLFSVLGPAIGGIASGTEGQVAAQDLRTGKRTVLLSGGTDARVLPSGHLLYIHNGLLLARPYDRYRMAVTGGPVQVLDGVTEADTSWSGQFSLADNGTLVYRPGGSTGGRESSFVWVDREGKEQPIGAKASAYIYPRLSPDGTRIAAASTDGENDIWIWDLQKETLSRLTFGPELELYPEWMPDSKRVVFRSTNVTGGLDVFRKQADGTGALEPLTENGSGGEPQAITPDGQHLLIRSLALPYRLFVLPLDGAPAKPAPLLVDPKVMLASAALSPNGRWLAYQSNESGVNEVYVRPFPAVDSGRWQVSSGGGLTPAWSRSGRELFYLFTSEPRMMTVPVQTDGAAFTYGKPTRLFDTAYYSTAIGRNYDVAQDGRFVMIKASGRETDFWQGLVVVTHFLDELRERVK